MVETIEQHLAWYGEANGHDYHLAWDMYLAALSERFGHLKQHAQDVDLIGRILSIEDHRQNLDDVDKPMYQIGMEKSGQAFVESAKTTYCLREDQLRHATKSVVQVPSKTLRGTKGRHFNRIVIKRSAADIMEMGDYFRALGNQRFAGTDHWANSLVEHLLPLVDTSRLRWDEVRFGVGYGLMLAHRAYRSNIRPPLSPEPNEIDHWIEVFEKEFANDEDIDS